MKLRERGIPAPGTVLNRFAAKRPAVPTEALNETWTAAEPDHLDHFRADLYVSKDPFPKCRIHVPGTGLRVATP